MIIGVTGKIGSGKTYWAMHYLVKKYFAWEDSILTWATKGNIRLVTNIKDCMLPHINLTQEIDRLGMQKVFSKVYCQAFQGTTVFVIDECQYYFDRSFKDRDVLLFLQTSRHVGCDIILITQDLATLALPVRVLCEYEIESTERSLRLKNVLTYRYIAGGQVIKRQGIKFDMQIAALYRSFEQIEGVPPSSGLHRYVGYSIGIILVLGLVLYFGLGSLFGSKPVTAKAPPTRVAAGRAPCPPATAQGPVPATSPKSVEVKSVKAEVDKLNAEMDKKEGGQPESSGDYPRPRIEKRIEKGKPVFDLFEDDKFRGSVRVH